MAVSNEGRPACEKHVKIGGGKEKEGTGGARCDVLSRSRIIRRKSKTSSTPSCYIVPQLAGSEGHDKEQAACHLTTLAVEGRAWGVGGGEGTRMNPCPRALPRAFFFLDKSPFDVITPM